MSHNPGQISGCPLHTATETSGNTGVPFSSFKVCSVSSLPQIRENVPGLEMEQGSCLTHLDQYSGSSLLESGGDRTRDGLTEGRQMVERSPATDLLCSLSRTTQDCTEDSVAQGRDLSVNQDTEHELPALSVFEQAPLKHGPSSHVPSTSQQNSPTSSVISNSSSQVLPVLSSTLNEHESTSSLPPSSSSHTPHQHTPHQEHNSCHDTDGTSSAMGPREESFLPPSFPGPNREVTSHMDKHSEAMEEHFPSHFASMEQASDDLLKGAPSKDSSRHLPRNNRRRKNMRDNVRPNAFVSIRVPSPLIREQLQVFQDEMVRGYPSLRRSMVSLEKLHLTLMVLKLGSREEEERAKEILVGVTEKLKRDNMVNNDPLQLEFRGLGHFGRNVVFVKVRDSPAKDKLHKIAGIVRDGFSEGGLPTTDTRPFQSHLTVAKTSRAPRGSCAGIPEQAYAGSLDREFGAQVVEGLELLSMSEPSDASGYYYSFINCPF